MLCRALLSPARGSDTLRAAWWPLLALFPLPLFLPAVNLSLGRIFPLSLERCSAGSEREEDPPAEPGGLPRHGWIWFFGSEVAPGSPNPSLECCSRIWTALMGCEGHEGSLPGSECDNPHI